jgi:hypothetical protein
MLLLENVSRPIYFNHSSMDVAMINDVDLDGIVVKV